MHPSKAITSSDPIELRDMMLAVQALRVELADGSGSGDTSDVNDAPNEKGGADGSSPASDDGGRPVNGRRRPSRIGLEINTSCPNSAFFLLLFASPLWTLQERPLSSFLPPVSPCFRTWASQSRVLSTDKLRPTSRPYGGPSWPTLACII